MREDQENRRPLQILLLTNCDSDNLGDWVIEACDIALISLVMQNLGIAKDRYRILSHSLAWVMRGTTLDEGQRAASRKIEDVDLLIFGGAPVFYYRNRIFYEKTGRVIELAQSAGIPVLFSAVGVQKYEEKNPKCRRITEVMQQSCVKQITTRDDLDSLKKFARGRDIPLKKVADPAIYSAEVFRNWVDQPRPARRRKRIGLFVLRAEGFKDNGINLGRQDMLLFWTQLAAALEAGGYTYTLLGSGNYGDEAFIDDLIRRGGIRPERCLFNLESPEHLAETIASFDAVISCRLHPSILAYSMGIPSLGIVWDEKVRAFYETIGYADRIFTADKLDAKNVAGRIGEILEEPMRRDEKYRYSVYRTLFDGIRKRASVKKITELKREAPAIYTPQQVSAYLPAYGGTSAERIVWHGVRKSRRTYEELNRLKLKKDRPAQVKRGFFR